MTCALRDRLLYPVLQVASVLAGTATGSCSGDQEDELTKMRDWLAWRVEGGWLENSIPMAVDYDRAVRAMARAALAMYDREKELAP